MFSDASTQRGGVLGYRAEQHIYYDAMSGEVASAQEKLERARARRDAAQRMLPFRAAPMRVADDVDGLNARIDQSNANVATYVKANLKVAAAQQALRDALGQRDARLANSKSAARATFRPEVLALISRRATVPLEQWQLENNVDFLTEEEHDRLFVLRASTKRAQKELDVIGRSKELRHAAAQAAGTYERFAVRGVDNRARKREADARAIRVQARVLESEGVQQPKAVQALFAAADELAPLPPIPIPLWRR